MIAPHEITEPGPVLLPGGALARPGWSRRAVRTFNREAVRAWGSRRLGRLRLKEWDFYAVMTREWSFAIAVAHGGLAGVVPAQWIDFRTRTRLDDAVLTPLGRGCALGRSSAAGDVAFARGDVAVELRREPERRRIHVAWPGFAKGRGLRADLVLEHPPAHESIAVATPIGARGFYYNEKACALRASGSIEVAGVRVDVSPASAFGTMDWGRGLWPYRTFWLWATGAGRLADGRALGLNLGAGFGDLSAATENAFFLDGRIHKLGAVRFEYDPERWREPWRFRSDDGRVDLTLDASLFELEQKLNALAIRSRLHQITGRFRGTLVTDAGERLALGDGVAGWAEEHVARW